MIKKYIVATLLLVNIANISAGSKPTKAIEEENKKEYSYQKAIEKTVNTAAMGGVTIFLGYSALKSAKKVIEDGRTQWQRIGNLLGLGASAVGSLCTGKETVEKCWKTGNYVYNLIQTKKNKK